MIEGLICYVKPPEFYSLNNAEPLKQNIHRQINILAGLSIYSVDYGFKEGTDSTFYVGDFL